MPEFGNFDHKLCGLDAVRCLLYCYMKISSIYPNNLFYNIRYNRFNLV